MRLSTDPALEEAMAVATIQAALDAGITVFDTARAYAPDGTQLGHNERLLSHAIRDANASEGVRIITKGGMTRAGDRWMPDGRAKAIAADCEASLTALGGLEIDLYLLHALDPRRPWRTSVRALARLADQGLVKRLGVSNVNLPQLQEAAELAPISAVQVAISPLDDRAVRGGLVSYCEQHGLTLIAHSPLGGSRRAGSLARREPLAQVAAAHEATAAEAALAWVLGLSANVVAIPGATRPQTARSAARAARLQLAPRERDAILPRVARPAPRPRGRGEIVLVMGIPGAGKSRIAADYAARGYARLSRDERGGSLRQIAHALDEQLTVGSANVILDNTYLTRAARSYVLEVAARHGAATRCVWLDTPLDQAQVNLVQRILDHFDRLPTPEELSEAARVEPGLMLPTSQMRTLRELEPPSEDEGFTTIERVPFERAPAASTGNAAAVVIAARALEQVGFESPDPAAPHLLFDWRPDGAPSDLDTAAELLNVQGPIRTAICPHGGGPPSCWCRPPLPALPLAFAREDGIDLTASMLVGVSPAHRTLARTLGMRYVAAWSAHGIAER
jgi:aryl-alcohol dehydrogenase-like predicted oxidoreductase/predicted kinase